MTTETFENLLGTFELRGINKSTEKKINKSVNRKITKLHKEVKKKYKIEEKERNHGILMCTSHGHER